MNKDEQREIAQLWAVAEMYYSLATNAKNHLDPAELKMTVDDFKKGCEDKSYLYKHTSLLYTVAHLTSGAIRLYSIEQRLNSERWKKYDAIKKLGKDKEVKKELEENIDGVIHFLLRHGVVHSETERHKKKAFEAMYDFFLTLSYELIFQAMAAARQSIKNDLDAKCLLQ